MGGKSNGNDGVAAASRLLAHQRLWVSPEIDVTVQLTELVERAGGSLTRALSADVFAIVVPKIVEDSREMAFALEHDLAIVTESEAIEQIASQLRSETNSVVEPDLAQDAAPDVDVVPVAEPAVVPTTEPDAVPAAEPDIDLDAVVEADAAQDAVPIVSVTADEALELEETSRNSNTVTTKAVPSKPSIDDIEIDLDEVLAKQASVAAHPVDDLTIEDFAPQDFAPESLAVDDLATDTPSVDETVIVAPLDDASVDDRIPAGWYPVSGSSSDERYHDGADWTEQFRSGGDSDPLAAPLAAFADEKNRWLAATAVPSLAVIIGSLGPWAVLTTSVGNVSVAGIEMSGSVAVLLAMASGGAMALGAIKGSSRARLGGIVGFVLAALLGLYEMTNLDSQVTDTSFANPSVGWGLWLVILGSLGGIALGVRLARFDADRAD